MRLTIMNYDENIFKKNGEPQSTQDMADLCCYYYRLITAVTLLTAFKKQDYYIIFLILCWLPIILGEILLRVKGFTTDTYKYDLVIGYGIFYTFVVSTTASPIALYLYPAGDEPAGSLQKQAFHDKLRHCEFHHYYRQCCISLHERI